MGEVDLQSCVVAANGFPDEVSLDELFSFVGTELELEALSKCSSGRPGSGREAGHLGIATHHGH